MTHSPEALDASPRHAHQPALARVWISISISQVAQEHATRAIWHLCAVPENQKLVVESGAIASIFTLCKSGSAAAQGHAAAVISELAKGARGAHMPRVAASAHPRAALS